MNDSHEESVFVRHVPCDACGSRDNNALYSDGHTHCFGCGAHTSTGDNAPTQQRKRVPLDLIDGEAVALGPRKITQATCEKYGYKIGKYQGKPCQVAPYYDADGNLVAQKVRLPDKDFKVTGDITEALPFGAHVWGKGGKKLVVTEGEIDALSMAQVQGLKWPVVSIACGADRPTDADGNPLPNPGTKIRRYFAKHREWFRSFEEVILMFDNDAPGRFSARVAAEVIGPQAKIAELPLKDANEMLVAGRTEELLRAMWNAQPYRPEGLVDLLTLETKMRTKPTRGLSLPFPMLDDLLYGVRTGEIIALGAGTGVGKTDFFTQLIAHFITVHQQPVGAFYMEQQPEETGLRIAGKLVQRPLHIPEASSPADLDAAMTMLKGAARVWLYDSFGANEWDAVREKVEYLVHAEGVRYFFLDHLTALAAAEDDERKALERIMAEMGALVKKLDITIFLISHLATPEGKPHEEGGRVMIRHFKGSRAIGFWCHYMIGLERDQQAEDPQLRTVTTVRVLKDRYTGRATGKTFHLGFDQDTGMLYETAPPNDNRTNFQDETEATGDGGLSDF